jgi:hypothetical protein
MMVSGRKRTSWETLFIRHSAYHTKNDCTEWTGTISPFGYGVLGRKIDGKTKSILAHRYAWYRVNGDIPERICVCHTCDNPACVNIDHLFLGDHGENMDDMANKGRANKSRSGRITDEQREERARDYLSGMTNSEMMTKWGVDLQAVLQWKRRWRHRLDTQ